MSPRPLFPATYRGWRPIAARDPKTLSMAKTEWKRQRKSTVNGSGSRAPVGGIIGDSAGQMSRTFGTISQHMWSIFHPGGAVIVAAVHPFYTQVYDGSTYARCLLSEPPHARDLDQHLLAQVYATHFVARCARRDLLLDLPLDYFP